MTLVRRKSSLSGRTAGLISEEELLDYADEIVADLDAENPGKLHEKWMACRIAELINEAKTGRTAKIRDAAKTECAAIILKLRQLRATESLCLEAQKLSHLFSVNKRIFGKETPTQPTSDDKFEKALLDIGNLCDLEEEVCRSAHVALIHEDSLQSVVEQEGIDESARRVLKRFSESRKSILNDLSKTLKIPDLVSTSWEARKAAIQSLLRSIQSERNKILDSI